MAKSSSDSKSTAKSLRQQVRDYISQQGHGTFNYKQVAAALGVNSQSQLRSIAMTLAEMDFDGDLGSSGQIQTAPAQQCHYRHIRAPQQRQELRNHRC